MNSSLSESGATGPVKKKPRLTPFMIYFVESKSRLGLPKGHPIELTKMIAEGWKSLPQDKKKLYIDMSDLYSKDSYGYEAAQLETLRNIQQPKQARKKKDSSALKGTSAGFQQASKFQRTTIRAQGPEVSFAEMSKRLGGMCKDASQQEKMGLEEKASLERFRFETDVGEYRRKQGLPEKSPPSKAPESKLHQTDIALPSGSQAAEMMAGTSLEILTKLAGDRRVPVSQPQASQVPSGSSSSAAASMIGGLSVPSPVTTASKTPSSQPVDIQAGSKTSVTPVDPTIPQGGDKSSVTSSSTIGNAHIPSPAHTSQGIPRRPATSPLRNIGRPLSPQNPVVQVRMGSQITNMSPAMLTSNPALLSQLSAQQQQYVQQLQMLPKQQQVSTVQGNIINSGSLPQQRQQQLNPQCQKLVSSPGSQQLPSAQAQQLQKFQHTQQYTGVGGQQQQAKAKSVGGVSGQNLSTLHQSGMMPRPGGSLAMHQQQKQQQSSLGNKTIGNQMKPMPMIASVSGMGLGSSSGSGGMPIPSMIPLPPCDPLSPAAFAKTALAQAQLPAASSPDTEKLTPNDSKGASSTPAVNENFQPKDMPKQCIATSTDVEHVATKKVENSQTFGCRTLSNAVFTEDTADLDKCNDTESDSKEPSDEERALCI